MVSHSEAVHVETSRPISVDETRELFAAISGVEVIDEPAEHRYPLALDAAGRDEIFVGRIRADVSLPEGYGLAFWVVSDNLRKGAATNAVELAELAMKRGQVHGRRG
jgi:aspartate-semialdehyde dehydrogenase